MKHHFKKPFAQIYIYDNSTDRDRRTSLRNSSATLSGPNKTVMCFCFNHTVTCSCEEDENNPEHSLICEDATEQATKTQIRVETEREDREHNDGNDTADTTNYWRWRDGKRNKGTCDGHKQTEHNGATFLHPVYFVCITVWCNYVSDETNEGRDWDSVKISHSDKRSLRHFSSSGRWKRSQDHVSPWGACNNMVQNIIPWRCLLFFLWRNQTNM